MFCCRKQKGQDKYKTEDARPRHLHGICVKTGTDTEICNIAGFAVLPDGRLAVVDYNNKCVKIIDITSRKITEKVSLKSRPRDITMIADDQLAVTLEDEKRMRFLSLSPTLSDGHTITLPGQYDGLTYNDEKLFLACRYPVDAVHICDMSGNLLQEIGLDSTGSRLFGCPSRITVSPDQSSMYVSDWLGNRIVCLSSEGDVRWTYVNDELRLPLGMAVHDNGSVYVCSRDKHCVHQLSPSGQLIKILLERKDEIQSPYAIAYSNGRLYISSTINDNIKVYSLE